MSHFSCFFFRKRRNKRNQTEREKRRKASAVSLGVLEKRLFRIKCSDRFSSLRRDCGARTPSANPTVPDLLVSTDGGRGRLPSSRREGSGDRLWAVGARPLRAAGVAASACEQNRSLVAYRFFKNGGVQPTFLPALGDKPSV